MKKGGKKVKGRRKKKNKKGRKTEKKGKRKELKKTRERCPLLAIPGRGGRGSGKMCPLASILEGLSGPQPSEPVL